MSEFRRNLGLQESGGRYGVTNSEGFTGKYQFGAARLKDYMSANNVEFSMEQFRQSPGLQERVQNWHESDILAYFGDEDRGLSKYLGREVGGVLVTPESVIAMAHLGGKGGMRKFLESGGTYNPKDSNGTRLSDYGQQFAGSAVSGPPAGITSVAPAAVQPLGKTVKDKSFEELMAMFDESQGARPVSLSVPDMRSGASGDLSPLSSLRLPNSDMIARYSTPGGIGTLKG